RGILMITVIAGCRGGVRGTDRGHRILHGTRIGRGRPFRLFVPARGIRCRSGRTGGVVVGGPVDIVRGVPASGVRIHSGIRGGNIGSGLIGGFIGGGFVGGYIGGGFVGGYISGGLGIGRISRDRITSRLAAGAARVRVQD